MGEKKLSAGMAELLEAMRSKGVICHYMPYMGRFRPNAYYFRSDTKKRCTTQAKGLLERGLVEMFDKDYRGHTLRAKEPA